jgi:putative FmdB family regulatory protein
MPLYEYRCDHCGRTFEVIQKFSDPPAEHCPNCGEGPVHKLMSSPAIQFKGSGWYVTDYARKGSVGASKSESDTKKDAAKPETTDKPAGKADKSDKKD